MKKRFSIALFLLLLLSTYYIEGDQNFNLKFSVDEILIENNKIVDQQIIKKKLAFIYETNLFSLKNRDIEIKLNEIDIIDSFEIKKIYPNKIKVKIFEKKPIAILQNKKQKKYFTNKNQVLNFFQIEQFKDLPIVFGDKDNFKVFYNNLRKIDFPISEIKAFYFFETKRWDILTRKNQTIKLPEKNYVQSLENFIDLEKQPSFKKYKIFDYRINDQLILK